MRVSVLVLVLVVGALLPPCSLRAAEQWVSWDQAQREATTALMRPETTLAALTKQVTQTPPKSGQEAMFGLSVLARAAMRDESVKMVHHLKRLCPMLPSHEVSSIYGDAWDHYGARDLAQTVVELFADSFGTHHLSGCHVNPFSSQADLLDSRLLKHFADSGWTVEQVDQWFAARPEGIDHFWVRERLRFNAQHGQDKPLARELAARVRANPEDVEACIGFLGALVYTRRNGDEGQDLAWIAEAIQPKSLTHAIHLAVYLAALENWDAAARFYRQATTMPGTEEELYPLWTTQVCLTNAAMRAGIAAHVRSSLAMCLQKMGKGKEAARWVAEATEIREKSKGSNRFLRFVPESEIKTQPKTPDRDPRYWCDRARYYRGRKETALEKDALVKGLALASPRPGRAGKGLSVRSQLLTDYVKFLRAEQAVALLRKEIAESPAESYSSAQAARLLVRGYRGQPGTDALLWTWLEKCPTWAYAEEHVLRKLLRPEGEAPITTYLARAEKLAAGSHPSRACTLGSVESDTGFRSRALPLFVYVIEKSQDRDLRERAACSLLHSYLEGGDWQRAEQVFPMAVRRLPPRQIPDWCSRIAASAARAGAKADGMRIWGRVANIDLTATGSLERLTGAGLEGELIAFYRDIQKQIPASAIPPAMLAKLGAPDADK